MGRDNIFLLALLFTPAIAHAACPDGYTTYLGTVQDGVARNSSGVCAPLCEYGGTKLATNTGLNISLFADKTTFPAVHVELNGGICYADLAEGRATGALNVSFNDKIYHTTTNSSPCPQTYTLSFDCGDGATGTPPEPIELAYGDLYTAPYDSCIKPGYSLSGWKIDSKSLTKGQYYGYTYTTDKTMVAQWTAHSILIEYQCNYCSNSTSYQDPAKISSVKYETTFTPPTNLSACSNPLGMKIDAYELLDIHGNNTGIILPAGTATIWQQQLYSRLRPQWSEGTPPEPTKYTLSFDCGDGATGTPPEPIEVAYRQLYTAPYNVDTCKRPGYYISGWKIDNTNLTKGQYKNYTYTTNKTMVAQWTAHSFSMTTLCDDISIAKFSFATYGNSYTPSTTVCTAPSGSTFGGYAVHDAFGNDTGDVIASGASFTWTYLHNIQLHAIWVTN